MSDRHDLPLLGHADPGDLVAVGGAGARTVADLYRDAAHVAAVLPPAGPDSGVLLIVRHDRYAFAAALLGAWAAGHRVVLPPNTRRDTIWQVESASGAVAMLHDTDAGHAHRLVDLIDASDPDAPDSIAPITPPPFAAARAVVYTSGSTGEMQAWPKAPRQLIGEARMLARHFAIGPGARVVATVAPGHIYGLLFSVLVPLTAGAAFDRDIPLHAEAVADRVERSAADVLVLVPPHVRALAALPAGRLATVRRVFCSTAPLDGDLARDFATRHAPITEILGSSETGGIAWRHRADDDRWTPLPGVTLAVRDDRLEVRSPFADETGPTLTHDLARIDPDGRFTHLGRTDGVVKIGGRRITLGALERHLTALDGVRDAAVVAVPHPGGRGQQLLAAIAADSGRWTPATLREALRDRFEASTLPRRFVTVEALPREDNGKLQRARLLRLFDLDPQGRPVAWQLRWTADTRVATAPDRCERRFDAEIPETYGWYTGHFPGHPILAGAVQLREIALRCARLARPELGDIRQIGNLKFLGRLRPGDAIAVTLVWPPDAPRVDFRITRGDTLCTTGRLTFAERPA
ncbi:MAG: AMP-binding protein [Myxococcales bacterium]|nr:AMP-binding protein [Myxococcales bacterium]